MPRAICEFPAVRPAASGVGVHTRQRHELDLFCEQHACLGNDASLKRKRQTQRRLQWLESLWEDPAGFEAVVKSGRYLRLCALTERLSDSDEQAWRRLKNEILAVRDKEFLCAA